MGSVALEGFGSGGGTALNFKVVDGTIEPVSPKENMIWVACEGMTGWHFAAEQPENMQPGEVWFSTGDSSTVAFNALKKGGTVMVYPISAKSWQDGVLVDVTAKSWQDGAWVEWVSEIVLYANGTLNTEYTCTGTVTDKGTYLDFATAQSVNTSGQNIIFEKKFNPSAYSTVYIEYEINGDHTYSSHELVLFDDLGGAITSAPVNSSGYTEIDTSTVQGVTSCRVGLRSYIAKQWVSGVFTVHTYIKELVVSV